MERRAAPRDVEAVKAILAAHAPMVYSYMLSKVGDADAAAALTREALLRFAKMLWEGTVSGEQAAHGMLRLGRGVAL